MKRTPYVGAVILVDGGGIAHITSVTYVPSPPQIGFQRLGSIETLWLPIDSSRWEWPDETSESGRCAIDPKILALLVRWRQSASDTKDEAQRLCRRVLEGADEPADIGRATELFQASRTITALADQLLKAVQRN